MTQITRGLLKSSSATPACNPSPDRRFLIPFRPSSAATLIFFSIRLLLLLLAGMIVFVPLLGALNSGLTRSYTYLCVLCILCIGAVAASLAFLNDLRIWRLRQRVQSIGFDGDWFITLSGASANGQRVHVQPLDAQRIRVRLVGEGIVNTFFVSLFFKAERTSDFGKWTHVLPFVLGPWNINACDMRTLRVALLAREP